MGKIRNPKTLSAYFNIDPSRLAKLGVLDPTLAVDTKLFVDPLLLAKSRHVDIKRDATNQYRKHFETVIEFLVLTHRPEDVAWKTARRLLEFHEIRGTCLGYGVNSIGGSGFGPELTTRVLLDGKEIVDLGVRDPDLFAAMALFEEKIGADRISDMTTNVIRRALGTFNRRILKELNLKGQAFDIQGDVGVFLSNPFQRRPTPIILVPLDVLRNLPIARSWDEIADAAHKTEALRKRVNDQIAHIWAIKSRRDKAKLRLQALASQDAFETLLDAIHSVPYKAYDAASDPEGLVTWARKAKEYVDKFPLTIKPKKPISSVAEIHDIVRKIIARFRQLIENNGLNRELYTNNREPRHESTAQRLFFAVAYCYCEANNLDISPECDSGSGQVDFKLSKGFDARVVVELKLSTNAKLVSGYKTQLETYKKAEQTVRAVYLVIDVGKIGGKWKSLVAERNAARARQEPLSDLELIDGLVKPSASKR